MAMRYLSSIGTVSFMPMDLPTISRATSRALCDAFIASPFEFSGQSFVDVPCRNDRLNLGSLLNHRVNSVLWPKAHKPLGNAGAVNSLCEFHKMNEPGRSNIWKPAPGDGQDERARLEISPRLHN